METLSKFDWYQATFKGINTKRKENSFMGFIKAVLAPKFGKLEQDWEIGKGYNGYPHGYRLIGEEKEVHATIGWGNPERMYLNAFATSSDAIKFSEMIRNFKEPHYVTRVDVCIDLVGEGLFDGMVDKILEIADKAAVKTRVVGDWLSKDSPDGRTLYVGAIQSDNSFRMYEKGKKEKGSGIDVDENWVRFEATIKPKGSKRDDFAKLSPDEMWGNSPWLTEVFKLITGTEAGRLEAVPVKLTNDERSFNRMIQQYGATMQRIAEKIGTEAVIEQIRSVIDKKQNASD